MKNSGTSRRIFLKTSAAVAGTMPLVGKVAEGASEEQKFPLMAYVGTFSSPLKDTLPTQVDLPPGNGKGIHVFEVDRKTGGLKEKGVQEMGNSPSCLVINRAGTHLYSANETDRVGKEKHGTVSAFRIDRANGNLEPINTVSSGGAGPTFVSLHPSGKYLFVANYFGGSVAVLPLMEDGRLGEATDVRNDEGKLGPVKAANAPRGSYAISGHDRTHAHMIDCDSEGKFVFHVDLALDRIFVWKFDSSNGKLIPAENSFVAFPPGDGPRHFHFHPNGKWFYSIQEEGSQVSFFEYEPEKGRLILRQSLSTLPQGYAGSNFCSGILVDPEGKYLFAGNRLHDSIALFTIGANGRLTLSKEEWTRGNYPRSFNFQGGFAYVCNQRSDNITVFKINYQEPGLDFTGQYVPVGNPSMITFLDLRKVKENK